MTGTIRHRGQNRQGIDRWQIQLRVPGGRTIARTVHGTIRDAELERDRWAAQLTLGHVSAAPDTLGAWLDGSSRRPTIRSGERSSNCSKCSSTTSNSRSSTRWPDKPGASN